MIRDIEANQQLGMQIDLLKRSMVRISQFINVCDKLDNPSSKEYWTIMYNDYQQRLEYFKQLRRN